MKLDLDQYMAQHLMLLQTNILLANRSMMATHGMHFPVPLHSNGTTILNK